MSNSSAKVLHVGGIPFVTTLTTLKTIPNTFFSALSETADEYHIDRDPVHFRHILNHLRGSRVIPSDIQSLRELRVEADYYNLSEYLSIIDWAIRYHPGSFEHVLGSIETRLARMSA